MNLKDNTLKITQYKSNLVSLFIILLPFLYTESTLDPVLTLRFLAFTSLVLILSLLSVKQEIEKSFLKNPIIVAFTSLFFVFILSAFITDNVFSEAIYVSLKLAVFIVFLISINDVFKDDKSKNKVFISLSLFSIICCFLFFIQYVNFLNSNGSSSNLEKLAATMANKNLLASVLFLTIPFGIYNLYSPKKVIKFLGLLSLFLLLIVLYVTFAKATLIALFFLVVSICLVHFLPRLLSKIFYLSALVVVILSTLILASPNPSSNDVSYLFKTKIIEFSGNTKLFENKYGSFGARLNLYTNTIDLIKNKPFLGVGPGNWKVQHGKYSLYLTPGENGQKIVQRPHNDILWIASEAGVIAGLIYLFLFLIALKYSHRICYQKNLNNKFFYYSIFGTILGYFFISFFDFPSERISHPLLFVILLAVIIASKPPKCVEYFNDSFSRIFSIFTLFLICMSSYIAFVRHSGEIYLTKAKHYKGKNSWQAIIKQVDKAYIPNMYEIDRSSTPLHWYRGVANYSIGKTKVAYDDFSLAYKNNPYHLHVINNIASINELNGKRTEAKLFYQKALSISPRFEEASVNLSAILFNEKKYDQALDVILRCNIEKDKAKYAKYLTTISRKYIRESLEKDTYSKNDRKKIIALKGLIDNDYISFKTLMRGLFEKRKSNKSSYLKLYVNNEIIH